jgi:CRISPR-associated protein Csm1
MGFKEVQLAALLHDIGKFEQRTGKNRNHADLGYNFVRKYFSEDVANIIAQHHLDIHEIDKNRDETLIVKIADHLSSGERERREREERGDPNVEGLLSIFCKIDIGKGELPEGRYYPLKPLALEREVIFPKAEHRQASGYDRLWREFEREFKEYGGDLETLYHLLWKYTWCVPSAVWRDVPDIALFDHLRTTCAIATCLYMAHQREPRNLGALFSAVRRYWRLREGKDPGAALEEFNREADEDERLEFKQENFVLIGGDISGIQRFIYNIKSPQEAQRGMARRLRGRSFYLTLLTDSIAHYLLYRLRLPITNLLWCGGGHFFILAPAVHANVIRDVEKDVNEFLLKEFQGELFIVIDAEPGSACDLFEFPQYLRRCRDKINHKKKRKAFGTIKSLESLNLTKLVEKVAGTCAVCGRDADNLKSDGAELCEYCRAHAEVGKKLPKMEYLVEIIAENEPENCDVSFKFGSCRVGWRISGKRELNLDFGVEGSIIRVYRINSTELGIPHPGEVRGDVHSGFKFYGTVVPLGNFVGHGGVMSFDRLVKFSKGVERLGVIRMDVDDLGKIFSEGLKPKKEEANERKDNRTISRITTLSRMLDLFFTGYINRIAESFWAVKKNLCRDCEEKLDELFNLANNVDKDFEVKFDDNDVVSCLRVSGYSAANTLCRECGRDSTPLVYITYSGGDDLFVVAPWDVAIEFAWKLRQEFSEYVAGNPNLTISAGVFLCREKFPIGRAAQISGELLDDRAKELPEKNAVNVFGESVPWVCRNHADMYSDFKRLFEFGRKLELYLSDKKLSRGFVYTMLSFWSETFRDVSEDRGYVPYSEAERRKRYMPRFKYLLARNVKDNEVFKELDDAVPRAVPWVRIPVNWALLRTRKRGG